MMMEQIEEGEEDAYFMQCAQNLIQGAGQEKEVVQNGTENKDPVGKLKPDQTSLKEENRRLKRTLAERFQEEFL